MAGKMGKRKKGLSKNIADVFPAAKAFHPPQKDNSRRQKRRAGLNNYKQDKED